MTDPLILPSVGSRSIAELQAVLTTGQAVVVPQCEHRRPVAIAAAGTCDPELMRKYETGGMAYRTAEDDTSTFNLWLTDPTPRPHKVNLKKPAVRGINQSLKNVPRNRKQARRQKNKQAKASRRRNR